jgi:hypothetical protein
VIREPLTVTHAYPEDLTNVSEGSGGNGLSVAIGVGDRSCGCCPADGTDSFQ